MIIKSFLDHVNSDSILYHWINIPRINPDQELTIEKFNEILTKGIKFKNDALNLKYPYCLSMTRSSRFKWGRCEIRISVLKSKVEEMYHVRPHIDGFGDKDLKFHYNEYEERVYSKKGGFISPKAYIKIECTKKYYDIFIKLSNPFNIDIILNDNLTQINSWPDGAGVRRYNDKGILQYYNKNKEFK
jgi:hypothetical protein